MKILGMARGEGKTTNVVLAMADNPELIFVGSNRSQIKQAQMISEAMGLNIDRSRFYTARQIAENQPFQGMYSKPPMVVDNLEDVLSALLGFGPVELATITTK